MTYRERREARAERLRGWADGRDAKASANFAAVDRIADGIPMGQPILVGHHSEAHARRDQDRIHAGMRAGIENSRKADEMRSRAANIEAAAGRAIYSDDPDAPERLRERIAGMEAQRDRIKAYNASARSAARTGGVGDLSLLDERQRADVLSIAKYAPYQLRPGAGLPAYALSNLGGNIGRLRERLAVLEHPRPRLFRPDFRGTCRTCSRPECDHDRRHDLPGSPVLCLA